MPELRGRPRAGAPSSGRTSAAEPRASGSTERAITPIIVVGMDRSGSKWLSNELSRHPDVISVQHARHTGILETNMFVNVAGKFDLTDLDEYVGCVEMWAATDFVTITGIEKEFFYRLRPRPTHHHELFRILMDEYARRNRKAYWLQKASPQAALAILDAFEGAKWVVVQRDIVANLRSKLRLSERTGAGRWLLRSILGYVLEEKILLRIRREKDAAFVTYEELLRDQERAVSGVLARLSLPAGRLEPPAGFDKNTSFDTGEAKASYFTRRQEHVIRLIARMARMLPLPVLRLSQRLVAASPRLVYGTFGGIIERHDLR